MLAKMAEVLLKIAVMMVAPGGVPAPPEARGGEPPFFFFFLCLLPRWGEGFPSGAWLPWCGRGESPSKIGSISLFLSGSAFSLALFHRFVYTWRSVTPIGLKPSPCFFLNISFLVAKEERQPPYGGLTRVGARPKGGGCLVTTSGTGSC